MWLLPRNIKTTRPSKKLDYEKIGLYKIGAKIGRSAYKLEVTPLMNNHNTFHISLLEPYQDNQFASQMQNPPLSLEIDGESEYEHDKIVNFGLDYGKLQY